MSKSKEDEVEVELMAELKSANFGTQVKVGVNMAKIGRWDVLRCISKPGVMQAICEECDRQGINTEQMEMEAV